jgi:hypothetical protein
VEEFNPDGSTIRVARMRVKRGRAAHFGRRKCGIAELLMVGKTEARAFLVSRSVQHDILILYNITILYIDIY